VIFHSLSLDPRGVTAPKNNHVIRVKKSEKRKDGGGGKQGVKEDSFRTDEAVRERCTSVVDQDDDGL
jgi:hypothetical protein